MGVRRVLGGCWEGVRRVLGGWRCYSGGVGRGAMLPSSLVEWSRGARVATADTRPDTAPGSRSHSGGRQSGHNLEEIKAQKRAQTHRGGAEWPWSSRRSHQVVGWEAGRPSRTSRENSEIIGGIGRRNEAGCRNTARFV